MNAIIYDENLKAILSYFPHIYYDKVYVPTNIDIYAVLYKQYTDVSTYKLTNIFSIHHEKYKTINYLAIDISLAELDTHIEQLERDEKLKEVMVIVNDTRL